MGKMFVTSLQLRKYVGGIQLLSCLIHLIHCPSICISILCLLYLPYLVVALAGDQPTSISNLSVGVNEGCVLSYNETNVTVPI